MAAPDGNNNNPNIVEHGKSTRFGADGGANPSDAASFGNHRRAQVRSSLRRLMGHVTGTASPSASDLAKGFGKGRRLDNLTVAEVMALHKVQQAMKNPKAMDTLIDHVDGKQVEKKLEAKVTLADIINGNFEGVGDGEEE